VKRQVRRLSLLLFVAGLLGFVTAACVFLKNVNEQAQGITSPSGTVTPSPGVECSLRALDAGTEGDVTTINRGSTVNIGVSLIGAQGVELVDAICTGQHRVQWSGGAPCLLASTGQKASLTAPSAAPAGASCQATACVGALCDSVSLVIGS